MEQLPTINPQHPIARFGPLKVLIAEDNEVNQLLARNLLMHWGFDTRVAINGFEVLDYIQNECFDLVLMDIQMPEMNGIEAAAAIRRLADKRKRNLPIIALTANALKGEELKYKAAGMDDFLTKPFREADLCEVIERVLENDGSFNRNIYSELNEMEVIETDSKLYDLVQLNEIANGNAEFMTSLAQIFLNTIPLNSQQLHDAALAGDWLTVSKLAHKLKSTVDSLNIVSLQKEIRILEMDGKNKTNTDNLLKLSYKVKEVILMVAAQLKEEFSL